MASRGHVLYFILLPLLAHVAADDADEQIMSEVMNAEQQDSRTNSLMRSSSSSSQPHSSPLLPPLHDSPLLPPPAFLYQLLQSSQRVGGASSAPSAFPESSSSSVDGGAFDGGDDNNGEVSKRVFCNGFTGCGGRHRDRSRRQGLYGKRLIPLLVKRPFCNSFGCYNGKRSLPPTSALEPSSVREEGFRTRTLARLLAASQAARHHQDPAGGPGVGAAFVGKRLFCNGYGGCRGGKRSLFSPWMSKMSGVVGDRR